MTHQNSGNNREKSDPGNGRDAGRRRKTGPRGSEEAPRHLSREEASRQKKALENLPGVFHEIAGGILVIRFRSPRFTLKEAEEARDIVYGKLEPVARFVLINLSGVDYIDSTAISLLVRVSNQKSLRLANISEPVAATLRNMQIFDLLYILPSEAEARRTFFEP